MRRKITVVGAGNVGAATAQRLAERDYADVCLVDVAPGKARGRALDLDHAAPVVGYEPRVTGVESYAEIAGSDLVVVTAGSAQEPGMSGDDRLAVNADVVRQVSREVSERCPDAIVVVVTNPLPVMCHVALEATGFPRQRVIGMAGILDSARLRTLLAWELGVSAADVTGLVVGGHGEAMVAVLSSATVAGAPVRERIGAQRLDEIVARARDAGAEVLDLLEAGSASYAPSAAVAEMVDAIVLDRRRVLPCAVLCQGEYGFDNLYIGAPAKLGRNGVEEIVEVALDESEREELRRSAEAVKVQVAALDSP